MLTLSAEEYPALDRGAARHHGAVGDLEAEARVGLDDLEARVRARRQSHGNERA
jgi:hypothetical protein